MSRDVDQSVILAVLRDRIAADGGAAREVREWVAQELAGLRIAGPWELSAGREGSVGTNPRYRCWRRPHLGRSLGCVARLGTGGGHPNTGPRAWAGGAASLQLGTFQPERVRFEVRAPMERLVEAMALLDEHLLVSGWLLMPTVARVCPRCEGWGLLGEERCPRCYGDGEDHSHETLRQQLREAGLEVEEQPEEEVRT